MQEDPYLQHCELEWACQRIEETLALLQLLFLTLQRSPAAVSEEQLRELMDLLHRHDFGFSQVCTSPCSHRLLSGSGVQDGHGRKAPSGGDQAESRAEGKTAAQRSRDGRERSPRHLNAHDPPRRDITSAVVLLSAPCAVPTGLTCRRTTSSFSHNTTRRARPHATCSTSRR